MTAAQAESVHRTVTGAGIEATLLDYDSTAFGSGIVITSAHISKGLEFAA